MKDHLFKTLEKLTDQAGSLATFTIFFGLMYHFITIAWAISPNPFYIGALLWLAGRIWRLLVAQIEKRIPSYLQSKSAQKQSATAKKSAYARAIYDANHIQKDPSNN